MNTKIDTAAWRFFRENAGGIVGESALTAARLVRSEAWLADEIDAGTMRVRWEHERESMRDVFGDEIAEREAEYVERYGCMCCVVERAVAGGWEIVDSLGMIVGDDDYHRVIEAEMASEAFAEMNATPAAGEFVVRWEMAFDAATPREAAERALEVHRDPASIAIAFTVTGPDGRSVPVDLHEDA